MPGRVSFDAMPLVILALTAAGIASVFALEGYAHFILALVALTTVVGVGLNVLLGLAGQVSLGHVGFYAIGAYAAAILTIKGLSFWLAWPLAGAIAGAVGAVLALPALTGDRPLPRHGDHRIRLHRAARLDRVARPDRRAERPDGHRRTVARRTRVRRARDGGAGAAARGRLALCLPSPRPQRMGQGHAGGTRCRDRRTLDRPQPRHGQGRGVHALGDLRRARRCAVRAADDVRRARTRSRSPSRSCSSSW